VSEEGGCVFPVFVVSPDKRLESRVGVRVRIYVAVTPNCVPGRPHVKEDPDREQGIPIPIALVIFTVLKKITH
jgi:hypothetical protein